MTSRFILPILCLTVVSLAANAQSTYSSPETGENPLGAYFKTDIDSVSLTNGNLHLHIPLFSLPGRELPVNGAVDYDSQLYEYRFWYWNGPNPVYNYESLQWRKDSGPISGLLTGSHTLQNEVTYSPNPYTYYWILSFVYGAPGGRRVAFPPLTVTQSCSSVTNYVCNNPSPPDSQLYDNRVVTLQNGPEFFTLRTGSVGNGYPSLQSISFRDGTRVDGTSGVKLKTANGNQLEPNYSTSSTTILGTYRQDYLPTADTVGRPITYETNGTTETITLVAANGQPQVYRIDWAYVPTSIAAIYEPTGQAVNDSFKVITAITLPNGKAYTFEYNSEGTLSKLTFPSGAYIRYQYTHPLVHLRAHVTSRWVSADGNPASETLTSYSYTYPNSGGGADEYDRVLDSRHRSDRWTDTPRVF